MSLDPAMNAALEELFSPGASAPLNTLSTAPLVVSTSALSPEDLVVEVVPLQECDVAELKQIGPSRSYATVQHTRAYHHIAALRLASGEKAGVVAAGLNLQPQTISRLLQNPQFNELIETYRGEFVAKSINTYELMQMVSMEAVAAIHEKLIGDERDSIPLEALRRIGETFSDRTGYSPIRRSESLNVNASGSISDIGLERVKARHGEDAHYRPQLSQPASLEAAHEKETQNQGAEVSIAAVFKSVEKRAPQCSSGKGESV